LNTELEDKIIDSTRLTSVTYPEKLSALNASAKELTRRKQEYEEKVAYSSEDDVQKANQFEEYEIEFLWAKLGNYATKHGIKIKLDINPSSTNQLSDMHFTLTGKYIPITDFVRSVEEDAKLGFKIEDFKLVPGENSQILQAEFNVKEVKINIDQMGSIQIETNNGQPNTVENNTNTNNTAS
jgi:hypothetical protein